MPDDTGREPCQRTGACMNRNTLRLRGARLPMQSYRGTSIGAETVALAQGSLVVAEFSLNQHESFRAEIIQRRGKAIVAISRWKRVSGLPRRTGGGIEFGAHRTAAIIDLLSSLQHALDARVHRETVQSRGDGPVAP
jgi:hypothetical protein